MTRPNKDGKLIISASEVGTYTVCPESWRLRTLQRIKTAKTISAEQGETLHDEWSEEVKELLIFQRWMRIIALLLVLAAAVFLLLGKHKII